MLGGCKTRSCHAVRKGLWVAFALCCAPVFAHEGPPFPLLMDESLSGYKVSVWADPDIGEARFFVIVESSEGGPPHEPPRVSLWTRPVSGRLQRQAYAAEQRSQRNHLQFEAHPHFDRRDVWTVGVQVARPGSEPQELTVEVESTPPGFGRWDLAIYLFPFLLLGGLWVVAMVRRRRSALLENWQDEQRAGASESTPIGQARVTLQTEIGA